MFNLNDILKATGGTTPVSGNITFTSVSTDTRTLKKGALYIALKGDKHDGHDYVDEAFNKGAGGAVMSKSKAQSSKSKINTKLKIQIVVPNTLKALQDIARFHRRRMKAKVVAVTGSSGKTTTKDMIASVLSQKGRTLKTEENLNNEIGVPLTLLKLDRTHKFAVIEMGMQGPGEIEELSSVAEPDIAVITNVGKAHLEKLKTRMNIAKAKGEVLLHLKKSGTAVLNADDDFFEYLAGKAKSKKTVSFGINNKADVSASNIRDNGKNTSFVFEQKTVRLPLPGLHNVYNALCAAAAGKVFGLPAKKIASGLAVFKASSKRMDIRTNKKGILIINDTYNANPSSMRAALEVLSKQKGRRIAVLGDMLELGPLSKKEHSDIGRFVASSGIEILITSGDLSKHVFLTASRLVPNSRYYFFKNKSSVTEKLSSIIKKGDSVLFKASRGMKFEKIAEKFLT